MNASNPPDSPGHLRWRCRRGMRELDVMLERFLERHYAGLEDREAAEFRRLLEQEDDLLWDWLSGRSRPPEQGMAQLVDRIRKQY